MLGSNQAGTIELHIARSDPTTLQIVYDQRVNVTYGCSENQFLSAIKQFDGYSSYSPSVVRTIYDGSNNLINTTTGAARIDYLVSIYQLRPTSIQQEKFSLKYYNNFTGSLTENRTQSHSPLLSGTWTLTIGGVPIKVGGTTAIPHNTSSWSM
jgi:hypothetical protein